MKSIVVALLLLASISFAPAANATSSEEMKKVVGLFTDTSIPAERSTEVSGGDNPYTMIRLKFKSGGHVYSAKLFENSKVQRVNVDVLYEGSIYNVLDKNGDGLIDEANDGHELLELDSELRTELSAEYQKAINAMLAYYKANKK